MHRRLILSIAAFLVALLASSQIAISQNAYPCVGRDLIAEMKLKDPAAYEKLVAEAAKIPNGDSAFWRIDGPPGTQPSWLLGTVHLSDPRVVELDPKVADALDKASVVAIETSDSLTPEETSAVFWRTARFLVLPVGTTVFDLLSVADAQLLRQKLSAAGFDPEVSAIYQPWVVFDHIIYPACERARSRAGFDYLDLVIAYRALANVTPVVGLEDPMAQSELLASIPMQDQISYLASAIRFKYPLEDDAETAVATWRDGKIALYYVFADGYDQLTGAEIAGAKRAETYFLDKRNLVMRDNAIPLIGKGNAFIAVGSYHLFGENGLVELLRKAGYKVTPVK